MKAAPVHHRYQCPYCELSFPSKKGVRMHGGYSHKTQMRKAIRILLEKRPSLTTAQVAETMRMGDTAMAKLMHHMSDVQHTRKGPSLVWSLKAKDHPVYEPYPWNDEPVNTGTPGILAGPMHHVCTSCGRTFSSGNALGGHRAHCEHQAPKPSQDSVDPMLKRVFTVEDRIALQGQAITDLEGRINVQAGALGELREHIDTLDKRILNLAMAVVEKQPVKKQRKSLLWR